VEATKSDVIKELAEAAQQQWKKESKKHQKQAKAGIKPRKQS